MGTPASTKHDASGLLSLAVGLSLLLLWCHAKAKPDGLCIPREREALLRFKRDLTDPSNRLSSWVEEEEEEDHPHTDCCAWSGVVCHNSTGHVLQLRLACTPSQSTHEYCWGYPNDDDTTKVALGGNLNPSLLNLKHLTHLDLSWNDFQGIRIPTFLASLENLRYLNLSHGRFGGTIPRQLTNLSSLQSLDLYSIFDDDYMLSSSSLEWAAGLTSLQFLGLSGVNLSGAHDWLQVTSRLPSLQQLILSYCFLPHTTPTSLPSINFSSLSVLDLSWNSLSRVPGWIFTLPALTSLSLSGNDLQGPIPVGLANLTALTSLWLSSNHLNSSLPKWVFDLHKLEELNLGWNSLQGRIPEANGNTTSLTTLDLSDNTELEADGGWFFKSLGNLGRLRRVYLSGLKFGRNTLVKDVKSLSGGLIDLRLSGAQLCGQFSDLVDHFSNLVRLDISHNSLQGSIPASIGRLYTLESLDVSDNQLTGPIPASIGRLSSLQSLDVSDNQLAGPIPASIGRLSSLESLDVSDNQLTGPIPASIGRLSSLESLDVSDNQLTGPIPVSVGRLFSLKWLDVSDNQLSGPIPVSIGRLLSLRRLDISHNQLSGTLPTSLGQLISLEFLDTSYNPMTGDVLIHFANLTKLFSLTALENRFSLKVRPNWVPPFQFLYLRLDSWQIGPDQFPLWLSSQTNLTWLQMSRSKITSQIPNWFWNSFPQLGYLNLSQSQIYGNLPPSSIIFPEATVIDLSFNQFHCVLPLISTNLIILNLAHNYFIGSISPLLCHKPHEAKQLEYLNLQNNHLLGEISDCWRNWTSLSIIRVGNNNLTGNLRSSIGFLYNLQSLHFENNHFQGEIPASLRNCTYLVSVDLGENNFVGSIPTWIGKQFALLKLLRLRSNRFDGKIPAQICALKSLQVLDLAHNNLSGSIPLCFKKFKAMTTGKKNTTIPILVSFQGYLPEDALLVWKGITSEYNKSLGLMTAMDLSSNTLSGEIPEDLMTLVDMRSLNLSNNLLAGKIPKLIGNMQFLESIDFSYNQISGQIPLSMSTLAFLSYLDLSNNKLVGRISSSTQLQSFNPSSYAGNKLCGPPITNNCSTMLDVKSEQAEVEDEIEVYMIFGSMTIGFTVGFWIICGALLFMKSWRLAYFKLIESLCQRIYDIVSTYK